MNVVGWVAAWVVVAFASAIWSGYVLTVLWGWFVVPVFALPALRLPEAIGVSLIVHFLTAGRINTNKADKSLAQLFGEASVWALVRPLFGLLFGWLVHLWMPA